MERELEWWQHIPLSPGRVVPRGLPVSHEAAVADVNIHDRKSNNCISCALAVDVRLAGGPAWVASRPANRSGAFAEIELTIGRRFVKVTDRQGFAGTLEDLCNAVPPGCRAIAIITDRVDGHAFNIDRTNGHPVILDGQIGLVTEDANAYQARCGFPRLGYTGYVITSGRSLDSIDTQVLLRTLAAKLQARANAEAAIRKVQTDRAAQRGLNE